eukprot:GHUV01004647.1.p1 GENE.GHUV01004647.1~~GHUV01004647.1.p1  ORF type:complete len:272 (-),score=50.61 GHUV01004647.1:1799-2614(-)
MVPRLQPGRLAQLIAALYTAREQNINGTLGPALRQAAEATGLSVVCSSDQVPAYSNEYNISAAMLAPDVTKLQPATCYSRKPVQSRDTAGSDNSCGKISKSVKHISPAHSWHSSSSLHCAVSSQGELNHSMRPVAKPGSSKIDLQPPCLFPVYVVIAGIDRGLEAHTRANMQILSQADFFWGLDKFWSWVGQQLGHYQTVPDVLLKPQSGMLVPWVRQFHEQHMSGLADQGYTGLEVGRQHSMKASVMSCCMAYEIFFLVSPLLSLSRGLV